MSHRERGIHLEGLPVLLDASIILTPERDARAMNDANSQRYRVQFLGVLHFRYRLTLSPRRGQFLGIPLMSRCAIRIQFDGAPVFPLGAVAIPFVLPFERG